MKGTETKPLSRFYLSLMRGSFTLLLLFSRIDHLSRQNVDAGPFAEQSLMKQLR